jgi:multidrug resistance efflux pump
MKTTLSIPRVALLALALATASVTATFAQTTTPPTCSAGGHHHHDSVLTADEQAQLKTAHDAALAANPSLKQQFEALKGNTSATKADWKALKAQLRAAELAADPTLAPIFAKLEAAHKNWHHSE